MKQEDVKEELSKLNLDFAAVRESYLQTAQRILNTLNDKVGATEDFRDALEIFLYEKLVAERNHALTSAVTLLKIYKKTPQKQRKIPAIAIEQAALSISLHDEQMWEYFCGCKGELLDSNKKNCKDCENKWHQCKPFEKILRGFQVLKNISFSDYPLMYLLIFCDSCQDEGRCNDNSLSVRTIIDDLNITENGDVTITLIAADQTSYNLKSSEFKRVQQFLSDGKFTVNLKQEHSTKKLAVHPLDWVVVAHLKVCMVSKYPPIEGGMSSRAYWTAKALGELGHEVHIVTNALEVEDEYREEFHLTDPNYQPKNVFVHSTDPSPTIEANPSHIPFSKMYCEKLASLTIKVIEDYNIDLIDSRYLVPYCVAGYIAKTMTGIPQVISHAGSDLQRLYPSPYLKTLLEKTLKQADKIITNPEATPLFSTLSIPATKISELPQVFVDTTAFNPQVEPFDLKQYITNQKYTSETPVIAYIGKITHHLGNKSLPELLKACSKICKDFLLLIVANGNRLKEFKALVEKEGLTDKTLFLPFLPPWKMPSILKACTCLVALENDSSPVLSHHVSTVPGEAIAVGKSILISKEIEEKEPFRLLGNQSVFVVDSRDVYKIKETLEALMANSTTMAIRRANADNVLFGKRFDQSIKETIRIYESSLKRTNFLGYTNYSLR